LMVLLLMTGWSMFSAQTAWYMALIMGAGTPPRLLMTSLEV
jgi:hypothetical protein